MIRDNHVVSGIIPTIGRSTINLCNAAIEGQTRPPDEVIVITDSERRGAGWARNEGIRKARGDLIAFLDDDCIPPKDWLERLISAIDKYDAAGAGGAYKETDTLFDAQRLRRTIPETEQVDAIGLVGTGGNVMYKRAWLDILAKKDGYVFNESFKSFGSEDWELALRLRHRGAKLIFVPNNVCHLRQTTPIRFLCHQFNRGRGIALLFRARRSLNTNLTPNKSLIFGDSSSNKISMFFNLFWHKIIGPFDVMSFNQTREFVMFWIGEKIQVAGFIWEIFLNVRQTKEK